jgi:hypothetical protein
VIIVKITKTTTNPEKPVIISLPEGIYSVYLQRHY